MQMILNDLLFFLLQNSDTGQRCPVDNEMLSEEQLFPDNFAKREILSLTVRCPNTGCAEKMELRHLEVRNLRATDRHPWFLDVARPRRQVRKSRISFSEVD